MPALSESQLLEALEYVSATAVGGVPTSSAEAPVLLANLELDSLAILELGIHLEEHYKVVINPSGFSMNPDATVHDLLAYINDEGSSLSL